MWNKVVSRGRWCGLALFLSMTGCTAISDTKYELGQKIRTGQAWHEFDGCNEQSFTSDYKSGWKAGYYDVATGSDGRPPVIPPKNYWKPPVFFEHDPSLCNDWYCGYQDGAACAKCQPDYHYLPTFMPNSHCQPVANDFVSEMPTQFPAEHLGGQAVEPSPMSNSGTGTETQQGSPQSSVPGETPSATDQGVKPGDYEKDPEPPNAQFRLPTDFEAPEDTFGKIEDEDSLLQRLVLNASMSADESNGMDEY